VWSLGVILYELVTTRMPFEATSVSELAAMVLRDRPNAPSTLRKGLPEELDAVILRCLAKEPDRRFGSVAELAMALAPFGHDRGKAARVGDVAEATRSTPSLFSKLTPPPRSSVGTFVPWADTEPAPGRPPRTRLLAVGVSLAAVLVVAGVVGFAWRAPHSPASPTNLPEARKDLPPLVTPAPPLESTEPPTPTAPSASAPRPALSLGQIPRKPQVAAPLLSPEKPGASPSAKPAAPKAADPHDLGDVGRK
jgi:serine/threonine-protein kinase